ncbi:DNA ligase D [Ottowia sp.]|uniref:DNA ligase D n=1 Tax=Ottowia sp. TaxID=1898956 RepID=UPI0025F1D6F9|nr:DNA ligase D [Ottowia sp.]MBK6747437.1 DNA ligase D [Ottowia sp.]
MASRSKPEQAATTAGRARSAIKPEAKRAADAPLARYRAKRDFSRTPEPVGGAPVGQAGFRYVIHKHWASRLHYDLRLEVAGAMRSWAVPKGPSLDPRDKRLAVQVEDHPIDYNDFEGQIPAGQYGGGRVIIWDRGTWSPTPGHDTDQGLSAGNFKFTLHGLKLNGGWALVRLKDGGRKNWLLIKEKDAAARPASEFEVTEALPDSVGPAGPRAAPAASPLPDTLAPQLATLADAPPSPADGWIWELKLDGYRLLARLEGGRAHLFTRNGLDWTGRLPALARALAALPVQGAWLDGEVVMPGPDGLPDFGALQAAFEGGAATAPLYYLFDLLHLDSHDWRGQPLRARRARLAELLRGVDSPLLRLSEPLEADPTRLLASACQLGLEGIIGKRADAGYRSGRSGDWIKLKCGQGGEFIVAGYTAGRGARAATADVGALVLATPDAQGRLRWAGNVGSGFDGATLARLKKRLSALATPRSALADAAQVQAPAPVAWVRPELVAQVTYAGTTREGRLRHAVFRGLRQDKTPDDLRADAGSTPDLAEARVQQSVSAMKSMEIKALADQSITHPGRVIDPGTGRTKLDLARYYATVAPLVLPHLAGRPVALLRAPDGIAGEQFFQKHIEGRRIPGVRVLDRALDPGHAGLLEIADEAGLLGAAQMNTVELHTWNARTDRIERPDRFVLDLDPGEGVAWPQVREAALLARTLLAELELVPFLKTSGGKGLHVVVPIKRLHGWDAVKSFSKALCEHLARVIPARFVAVSGPRNRVGKIYADYLRNGRGATTVCAWSARARPGMGVSVPLAWDELGDVASAAQWHLGNIGERLRVGNSVWKDYGGAARSIGPALRQIERASGCAFHPVFIAAGAISSLA